MLVDRRIHDEKLYTYKELLKQLPTVNYQTLKLIVGHLNRSVLVAAYLCAFVKLSDAFNLSVVIE